MNHGVDQSSVFRLRFEETAGELTYAEGTHDDPHPTVGFCSCEMYAKKWRANLDWNARGDLKPRVSHWLNAAVQAEFALTSKAFTGYVYATMHFRYDAYNNSISTSFSLTAASDTDLIMEHVNGISQPDLYLEFTVDGEPALFVKHADAPIRFDLASVLADTVAHMLF